MKVYRMSQDKNKETFKVPSVSNVGTYYSVDKLLTTAGTYVYRCECIGFQTRQKVPDFKCKHIYAVVEFLENESQKEVKTS